MDHQNLFVSHYLQFFADHRGWNGISHFCLRLINVWSTLPIVGSWNIYGKLELKRNDEISSLELVLTLEAGRFKFKVLLRCLSLMSLFFAPVQKTGFLFTIDSNFNSISINRLISSDVNLAVNWVSWIVKRFVCFYVEISTVKLWSLINLVSHLT